MKPFLGVFCYEYRMSIRRWSLWLAFGLLMVPYLTSMFLPSNMTEAMPGESDVMEFAGTYAFMLNLFLPVAGGILVADRLVRDRKIGVDELLRGTPLNHIAYLAGKYCGALASLLTPLFLGSLLIGILLAAWGAPLAIIPAMLLAFLGVNLPAYAFITAFSLACPLVMPVRVYQVLFTGYWFWGNYLSPTVMPTVNGTYLTANGEFMLGAFFGGFYAGGGPVHATQNTHLDVLLNMLVLGACAFLILWAAERYLTTRAVRA